jgi:hypothetical protein
VIGFLLAERIAQERVRLLPWTAVLRAHAHERIGSDSDVASARQAEANATEADKLQTHLLQLDLPGTGSVTHLQWFAERGMSSHVNSCQVWGIHST